MGLVGESGCGKSITTLAIMGLTDDDEHLSGEVLWEGRDLLKMSKKAVSYTHLAIGMSLLSSSYQVANNLPNMLYELVMGGMLVTAFLPVYMGCLLYTSSRSRRDFAS